MSGNVVIREDMSRDPLSEAIIGAAIEIHRTLGPGLLESVYEDCMEYELKERGFLVARQIPLEIRYKNLVIANGYKVDLMVQKQFIIELKSVERVLWLHEAQLLTYLKLSGIHRGLLLNFNVPLLKDGIKRLVY